MTVIIYHIVPLLSLISVIMAECQGHSKVNNIFFDNIPRMNDIERSRCCHLFLAILDDLLGFLLVKKVCTLCLYSAWLFLFISCA